MSGIRNEDRARRASQQPIMGGLPDAPGIGVAMRLTPGLGLHLRALADELLVNDFPGATLVRAERELIATAVSAANDCFFCMDSHGAHATALMRRTGDRGLEPLVEAAKDGSFAAFEPKMRALVRIARTVAADPLELTDADVEAARAAGASDGDVQLAVLIAAGFSMFNRLVDGFRARTAPEVEAYAARAEEIAERGYAAPSAMAPGGPAATRS